MKFFVDNWYLFAVALVSGSMLVWPLLRRGSQAGAVSPADAVQLINRDKATLIDIGEPAEYANSHAAGARNVPFGSLETSNDLPKNKALPIVVVSESTARASRAVGILRKRGYENTRALAGGLSAWREANLPVDKKSA